MSGQPALLWALHLSFSLPSQRAHTNNRRCYKLQKCQFSLINDRNCEFVICFKSGRLLIKPNLTPCFSFAYSKLHSTSEHPKIGHLTSADIHTPSSQLTQIVTPTSPCFPFCPFLNAFLPPFFNRRVLGVSHGTDTALISTAVYICCIIAHVSLLCTCDPTCLSNMVNTGKWKTALLSNTFTKTMVWKLYISWTQQKRQRLYMTAITSTLSPIFLLSLQIATFYIAN